MNRVSNLAWRLPVAVGVLALASGCYTVFSHPQAEVQTADSQYSDCGSCHAAGFASPILPDPYTYVSTPFQDFYSTPWWLPDLPSTYSGGAVGGGSKRTVSRDEEDGRHVGGRGAVAPPSYDPPGAVSTPSPPPNRTATGSDVPKKSPGQQKGRTMKDAPDKESSSQKEDDDSGG